MADAETGCRHHRQTFVGDGVAAHVAGAVGTLVQPLQRPVDRRQLGLHLLEDGELLLALERVTRGVGRVLVDPRSDAAVVLALVVEVVVLERGPQALEPVVLDAEVLPGEVVLHRAERTSRPPGLGEVRCRWGWRVSNPRASA